MTEHHRAAGNGSPPDIPKDTHGQRPGRDIVLIILFTCLAVAPSFFTRDLWNPDEPRYMEVAREMAVVGTLGAHLVPHLNGELYAEKPPLFFWLAGAIWRLGGGMNSGRILVGLAALGTVLLVYGFARRRWPAPAPILASLCTLTCFLFLGHIRAGVIDPVLSFFTTAAVLCGSRALETEGRRARRWWLAAYAATGPAVLTKGHVGFIVPLLVLLVYGLWNRRRVHGGGWIHVPGALLLIACVAAWLVPAGVLVGWDYVYTLTIKQALGRAVKSYSHRGPFYEYIEHYPILFYPWFLLFIPAVMSAVSAWRRRREEPALFALVWFGVVFLFFSAMSGKRNGYLMPLAGAFGLLMGRYLALGLREGWPRPRLQAGLMKATFVVVGFGAVAAATLLLLVGSFPGASARLAPRYAEDLADIARSASPLKVGLTVAPLFIIAAVAAWGVRRAAVRGASPVALLVGVVLMHSLHADLALLPIVNRYKSARHFCDIITPILRQSDEVYFFRGVFSGLYNLYLGRTFIPVIEDVEDLRAKFARPERIVLITCERHVKSWTQGVLHGYPVLYRETVGHRRMLLIGNWPSAAPPERGAAGGGQSSKPTSRPTARM